MAYDVFVSYSHEDKLTADAICGTLEGQGIRCWIAPRDINPGQEWGQAIIQAISGARIMVVVFSHHSNESRQVMREVERAVHGGLAVLPFRIEDIKPSGSMEYFLSSMHWLDALTEDREAHILRLASSVSAILDGDSDSGADRPKGVESTSTQQTAAKPTAASPRSSGRFGAIAVVVAAVAAALLYFGLRDARDQDPVTVTDSAGPAVETTETLSNSPAATGEQSEQEDAGDMQPGDMPAAGSPDSDAGIVAGIEITDAEPVTGPVPETSPDAPVPAPAAVPVASVAKPMPAEPVERFVAPPPNSVVADTPGDYEYAYVIQTAVEGELAGHELILIDPAAARYGGAQPTARFRVATTVRVIDSRQLEFYGRTQTQYTVALTLRTTDLTNGASVFGPITETVQYTSINAEQNLKQAASELARRAAEDLNR
ncbi:MAG: toll/interleukin-1 receptor domain-containing protein [Gammaproteobacteria bacterium]